MTRRRDLLMAWADTRWAMRLDAAALSRRRAALWRNMTPVLAATPALAQYAGRPLSACPITNPATMRADPDCWNSAGIDGGAAVAMAQEAERGGTGLLPGGVAAGFSTGTSGSRGVFLSSPRERARYLGQSVARLLPATAPIAGARIALILRADSALYRDVASGRFAFLHLATGLNAATMAGALRRFEPTVLIAPPRELATLASSQTPLPSLRHLFWGGEPMGLLEREWIGARLGRRPAPIYQATEGFIAAACRHGALHLNDDSMAIELQAVPSVDAWRPVVTDLRRHVQPMVRVRLDDLVQPTGGDCPCGFAGRVIAPVGGRVQDIWDTDAGPLRPDAVDRQFEAAVGPDARWRVAGQPGKVLIESSGAAEGERLRAVAARLVSRADIGVRLVDEFGGGPKRRRATWRAPA